MSASCQRNRSRRRVLTPPGLTDNNCNTSCDHAILAVRICVFSGLPAGQRQSKSPNFQVRTPKNLRLHRDSGTGHTARPVWGMRSSNRRSTVHVRLPTTLLTTSDYRMYSRIFPMVSTSSAGGTIILEAGDEDVGGAHPRTAHRRTAHRRTAHRPPPGSTAASTTPRSTSSCAADDLCVVYGAPCSVPQFGAAPRRPRHEKLPCAPIHRPK